MLKAKDSYVEFDDITRDWQNLSAIARFPVAAVAARVSNSHGSLQPTPQAFSARSFLDSTMSCDVNERCSPAFSQTSRGQRIKRERLGTRLGSL